MLKNRTPYAPITHIDGTDKLSGICIPISLVPDDYNYYIFFEVCFAIVVFNYILVTKWFNQYFRLNFEKSLGNPNVKSGLVSHIQIHNTCLIWYHYKCMGKMKFVVSRDGVNCSFTVTSFEQTIHVSTHLNFVSMLLMIDRQFTCFVS